MALNIGDNFKYLGKKFLDDRESFDTLEAMNSCNDVPERFITYCKETDKRYEYKNGAWVEYLSDINIPDNIATTDYVDDKVAGLVNSAPETLDTLNKLSQALGDDPNFATTIANELGNKADKTEIPTKVSQLENDSNYASKTFVENKVSEIQLSQPEIDLSGLQTKVDETLETTDKTISGAINEINTEIDVKFDDVVTSTSIDEQNNELTNVEEFITQKGLDESSAKMMPIGTLLIAMYGQGKTRGMTAYLGIEASTNQACACILPSKVINQKFLWYYFILSYDKLRDLAKGGNQPNLNGNMIKDFPVLMPPIEMQNEYVSFVQQIDKSKFAVQKSLEKTETLYKSLMQQYFG